MRDGARHGRPAEDPLPRKRRDGESSGRNQREDANGYTQRPLAASLNVNPTGAALIPSRPTSSAAAASTVQRKRLLASAGPKTVRENSSSGRFVHASQYSQKPHRSSTWYRSDPRVAEREPMSARDRYYVEQRAMTAPGGSRYQLRPPVTSGGDVANDGRTEEARKLMETPELEVTVEKSDRRCQEAVSENDTTRRGGLFARRHEVKTLAEKLVDKLSHRANDNSADNDSPVPYGLTTPSGAVPRDSFFYMRRVDSNPYNLEVTNHSRINPKDYFTVSRLGVTHFSPDGVDFLPLQRFERENYIFSLLIKVRNACLDLQEARLFDFEHPIGPGEVSAFAAETTNNTQQQQQLQQQPQKTYTLAEFSLRLKAQKIRVERLVDHFISDSEMMAKHACEKYLYSFLQSTGFNGSNPAGTSDDKRKRSSVVMNQRKESKTRREGNNAVDQKPMTYTERATMRTQCRRVTKFLRVVEFLVSDALLRMAISSTVSLKKSLITFIHDSNDEGDLSGSESPPGEDLRNKAGFSTLPNLTSKPPLIRVEVALKSGATNQLGSLPFPPRAKNMSTMIIVDSNATSDTTSKSTGATRENEKVSGVEEPMDMLEFTPSVEVLRLQLETLVFNGLSAVTNRERLLRNSMFKIYVEASLDDGAQDEDGDDDGGELSSATMDLDILIMEDATFVETLQGINSIVLDAYEHVEENCGELSVFLERYQENTRFCMEVSEASRHLDTDVHDFRELLDKYIQQTQQVDAVAESASCGLLLLDRTELNSLLKPSPRKCLDGLYKLIPIVFRLLNEKLVKELTSTNDRISTIPSTVEEFSESLAFLRELQANHDEMEEKYRCVRSLYHLLEEYRVKVTDTDQMNAFVLTQKRSQLKASIDLFETCCEQYTAKFGIELEARLPALVSKLTVISNALSNSSLFELKSDINDTIIYLTRVEGEIIQLETDVKLHFQYEKTLGLPQSTGFEELDELKADLTLKLGMWKMFKEWQVVVSVWEKQQFPDNIDFTTIADQVEHFYNRITGWEQRLSEGMGALCAHLKSCVDEYRATMPILTDLRCPSFEERHYVQLRELLGSGIRHLGSGRTVANAPVLTLGDLVQMHLSPYGPQINRIATEATQERLLKDMLTKIIVLWERLEFDVKPHKDSKEYYVLTSLETIYTILEESLVSMAMVLSSKFLSPIKDLALTWHKRLLLFQETFDAWIECQRQWIHLETIFSAPDIQKQLPNEGAVFLGVNQFWKDLMRRTRDQRGCLKVTGAILISINPSIGLKNAKDGGTGVGQALLDSLTKHNSSLERIEKSLEDYLEMKRRAFPRFYFISNDELLEILAHAKEPQVVQRHLPKCFDALVKLDINDEAMHSSGTASSVMTSQDIVAMVSPEGERVAFGRTLKARGNIEDWMNAVLVNMKTSLHRHVKTCLGDYQHSSRETWLFRHPAQAVAVVSSIIWAKECEFCFRSRSQDPVRDLSLWHQTICSQLNNLTRLVRTSLTHVKRRVVVSLVTTDVHFRDIVESLVAKRVTDERDFLWEQQLRYQWYAENDECEIQQANCRIKYGYEYMGACSRLVITPLTDRCWMTITGALELRYGAAPSGPAGTGKTETSKDLAKALGILCIVINCSSQMSCKMMGSILNGVIQAGTWICLDEFNRIDIEVLSVVGQQMSVLRNARLMGSSDVLLDGQSVPLREHHVIITMNPGYVGRTELPDNLKVSFRPVAMMVPDYALIAEILLFAEGFRLAKSLSRKITKLYKLCSEQLSQQAHYDFGMRAVRTVLTMAGSLKRSGASIVTNLSGITAANGATTDVANSSDENVILIKAMVGANTPKLTDDDNRLFLGIVRDLFPDTLKMLGANESEALLQGVGVFTPLATSGGVHWMNVLENEVCEQLRHDGLQSPRQWIKKILQLFATLEVRVGVVQIGSTGSGKSTALKILKAAVSALRDRVAHPDTRFQRVVSFTLNPKALSMVELYGFFHPVTHEWTDGLASKLLRTCIMEKNEEMLARHYANVAVGVNNDHSAWNLPFYWINFDGPIDVHWIESMNTVLDDNMTLCLANGERIKLLPKIQLLFEVADTSAASPATISRLGMVYYPCHCLGWQPFVDTWISKLTAPVPATLSSPAAESSAQPLLNSKTKTRISKYFEVFVAAGLSFLRSAAHSNTSARVPIATCELAFVATICHIFQVLLAQRTPPELFATVLPAMRGSNSSLEDTISSDALLSSEEQRNRCLDLIFIFSFAWSIGGNLNLDQQKGEFQDFLYNLISSNEEHLSSDILAVNGKIPTPAGLSQATGDIHDFFIDFQNFSFSPWANILLDQGQQQQPSRIVSGRLLVPTLEILKYRYLVELLTIDARKPVLLTGATGSGKSALVNHVLDVHARIAADINPSDSGADSLLSVLAHGKVLPLVLNMSAQTSSDSVQLSIESKFAKKRRTLLGAPVNKQLVVVFIDDVNMPSVDQHGAQPVIELLRQYLEFEGFYDREKFYWKDVKDSVLIAAGGLPGGGRQPLCPRFTRHFHAVFYLPSCNEAAMKTIFNSILAAHIVACGGSGMFAKNVKDTLLQTADATCELFQHVVKSLLPTPSKCHYTFNLRDVTKLMQGIVLGTRGLTGATSPSKQSDIQSVRTVSANTVVSLWAHEGIRVFRDRLMDDTDRTWFSEQLVEIANRNFGLSWTISNVFSTDSSIDQSHLLSSDGSGSPAKSGKTLLLFSPRRAEKTANNNDFVINYDQVGDLERYKVFLNGQIAAYNSNALLNSAHHPSLDLVLFEDAMVHTAAISRILVQPRGHAMLLGMGGCGKRSLARLAAFMTGFRCFEIEMKKNYGIEDFRDNLKYTMKLAALGETGAGHTKSVRGKAGHSTRTLNTNIAGGTPNPGSAIPTVFLINDSQLVSDSFLEDINTILNGGDIPKLFASDELEKIINDVKLLLERITNEAKASQTSQGHPSVTTDTDEFSRKDCEDYFHSMVQSSLHFVICMNPSAEVFRARVRQFPALINCTTIDYFNEWPKSALEYVAEFYLSPEEPENRFQGISVQNRRPSTPNLSSSPVIRSAVTSLCVEAHQSISAILPIFFSECRRQVYITSQHYLDLIALFRRIYQEKRAQWETKLQRLMAGVVKLEETNAVVATLQEELVTLQPVLVSKTKEAEELLAQVAIDQVEAEQVAKRVGADEAVVKEQQQEVAACQADAQRDLDQAIPALNAAVAALDSLDKKDITEVKGFVKPPQAVQVVMEAVCIMLGEKADWDNSKRILSRSTFMSELKDYDKDNIPIATLKKVRKYIDNPEFAVEEVKKVSHAAMSLCMWVHAVDTYARVFREVSPKRQRLAEMNLVLERANAKLATKQQELSKVLEKVRRLKEQCDATLTEKQRLLDESELTQQRLQNAEKLTVGLQDERIRWKSSIKLLKQEGSAILGDSFLTAACMSYLGSFDGLFRGRLVQHWAERTVALIGASTPFVLATAYGDVQKLREWQLLGLPSDSFSTDNAIYVLKSKLRWALMIDPQQQATQWIKRLEAVYHLETVKSDDKCLIQVVEDCLVGGKPLLIEDITETLDPSLEPVLTLKPYQRSNHGKRTYSKVQIKLEERLLETDVDLFRLYLTTKLANPHFLPDVFIRVNVVNFTVTRDGLEEQLLSDVVLRERMEIEERKHALLASIARDQQQLQNIEIKILNLLSDAKGNILDDTELIQALEKSKQTSNVVAHRLTESEATKLEVLQIRNQYQSVAVRGAILFFAIADLVEVDSMYQYSLEYFSRLFNLSLNDAPSKCNLSERLDSLKHYMTLAIYRNICRGLFKAHKKLFAFVICLRILINAGDLNPIYIRLLDQSVISPDISSTATQEQQNTRRTSTTASIRNPGSLKDTTSTADVVFRTLAKRLPIFTKVLESYCCENDAWCSWIASENPFVSRLPGDFNTILPRFLRLVLVRWLREDAFTTAVCSFVEETLGTELLAEINGDVSMHDVYCDVDRSTPCMFILSPGADPISALERYAREKGLGEDKYHVISLGQGQGPIVELKMEECKQKGFWLILQNVHLAKSWLPTLQSKLSSLSQDVRSGSVHQDFRLFLASFPVTYFPISILQNSVKVMTESPNGVKANLQRSMLLINQLNADLDKRTVVMTTNSNITMKLRLAFGLSFFHAVVRERSKFGTLGWNLKYDFSDADFVSVVMLQRRLIDAVTAAFENNNNSHTFQEDAEVRDQSIGADVDTIKQVPWDALLFLAGEIYYGGRVTDECDRRCLMAVLRRFCSKSSYTSETQINRRNEFGIPKVFTRAKSSTSVQNSLFSSIDDAFFAPEFQSEDEMARFIDALPEMDGPDVFGMHPNAHISYQKQLGQEFVKVVVQLQSSQINASGVPSTDADRDLSDKDVNSSGNYPIELATLEICQEIHEQLPPSSMIETTKSFLTKQQLDKSQDPLTVVLQQEVISCHKLVTHISSSLGEVRHAIRGIAVMTVKMEKTLHSLVQHQVPDDWIANDTHILPTTQSLSQWLRSLLFRCEFLHRWAERGRPPNNMFPLPVFSFPQGLFTAILQRYARKQTIPIHFLDFQFRVLGEHENLALTSTVEATEGQQSTDSGADEGAYLTGLLLEGAQWNSELHCLWQAQHGVMWQTMPAIHILPQRSSSLVGVSLASSRRLDLPNNNLDPSGSSRETSTAGTKLISRLGESTRRMNSTINTGEGVVGNDDRPSDKLLGENTANLISYSCPVYRTGLRKGTLSTTGTSTNLVLAIDLPCHGNPDYFVLNGTALICSAKLE
ncbi:unnamed protein product [Phytophthora fragariaefolia]|uniref:Unnamed protein product n=1 Tax=Phytophthora fragariaefolia TaxID=1490495 RepID=A0A9W6YR79_9STRA|nr:unnamed protein product [Phytophthora fragariaefolia]